MKNSKRPANDTFVPTTVLESRLAIKVFFVGSLPASYLLDQPREDRVRDDQSEPRERWGVGNPLAADPVESSLLLVTLNTCFQFHTRNMLLAMFHYELLES